MQLLQYQYTMQVHNLLFFIIWWAQADETPTETVHYQNPEGQIIGKMGHAPQLYHATSNLTVGLNCIAIGKKKVTDTVFVE